MSSREAVYNELDPDERWKARTGREEQNNVKEQGKQGVRLVLPVYTSDSLRHDVDDDLACRFSSYQSVNSPVFSILTFPLAGKLLPSHPSGHEDPPGSTLSGGPARKPKQQHQQDHCQQFRPLREPAPPCRRAPQANAPPREPRPGRRRRRRRFSSTQASPGAG